ncbi:MarR family winged helix-turn-helix transcriptional regulator [Nonomuraea sp. KM88]|uniref:MarR family winged helix-turn-helix transcriptional regulator n=1 Tax=Nonomuraea sp. KM88 TaxID=3457427 RepID=UPI003FCE8698
MDQVLEFVLAVKAVHREINRRFSEALRPLGITVVQAEAILILADGQPLTLGELGSRLIAETGNPSRLVDRLHNAGLVHRHPSAHDRRHVELTLTPHGHEMVTRIQQARRPLLEWGRTLLDDTEFAAATTALRRVLSQP